jgi:hypothetical protein
MLAPSARSKSKPNNKSEAGNMLLRNVALSPNYMNYLIPQSDRHENLRTGILIFYRVPSTLELNANYMNCF